MVTVAVTVSIAVGVSWHCGGYESWQHIAVCKRQLVVLVAADCACTSTSILDRQACVYSILSRVPLLTLVSLGMQ
jgi:hypothetical protein